MNQTPSSVQIRLLDLTKNSHPFGNFQGKAAFRALSDIVDAAPRTMVFGISLAGIVATDASFPRESVVAAAKYFRGQRWFYLTDLSDRDLVDNWKYAAQAKQQPLVIWHSEESFEVIGPDISSSASDLLDYVLRHRKVSTAQVATDLGLSVPNASTRLKKLVTDGYLLRQEDIADSGGIEYTYSAIR